MHQSTSVSEAEEKKKGPKTKSLSAAVGRMARDLTALGQSAVADEVSRSDRKQRLVKLFRVGFRGIEKSIANHPSYTEDDLDFLREEGFNV